MFVCAEKNNVLLKYKSGAIADLSCATLVRKPNEGYIYGTKGFAYLKRFYAPQEIVPDLDGKRETIPVVTIFIFAPDAGALFCCQSKSQPRIRAFMPSTSSTPQAKPLRTNSAGTNSSYFSNTGVSFGYTSSSGSKSLAASSRKIL